MDYRCGDLENIVMNAVWSMEVPEQEYICVCDVQERINFLESKNWAYTTVKTVMDRLVEKAMIIRFKKGKKYFYKSVLSREEMAEEAMKKLAKQYFHNDMTELKKMADAMCEKELSKIQMNSEEEKKLVSSLILGVLSGRIGVLEALKRFPKDRYNPTIKCCWHALVHYEADEDLRRKDADYKREQDDYLLMLSEMLDRGEDVPQNILDEYEKYHGDTMMPYGESFGEKFLSLFKFLNIS